MKDSFVNIATVFEDESNRNVESLKRLYGRHLELLDYITSLVDPFLDESLIKGKRVFLKPNWVRHGRKADHDEWCLTTHENFLVSVTEYFLLKSPRHIVIGDAPIQSCKWDVMLNKSFFSKIASLSEKYRVPIFIKDYRRVVFDPNQNVVENDRSSLDKYTIFDLGKDSYLEPISYDRKNPFRVTSYDPARLALAHGPGYHKYCITHELFDSDIVISIPKIKTHQKTGITAALKNIVGLNGDKDFLPHHRKGGNHSGGDCYPGDNPLRRISEDLLDFANSRRGKTAYWIGMKFASLFWKLSLPGKTDQVAAGWYGNDTTWRMVMDLNKIALFGTKDGKIANEVQRHYFSLGDGIIGGQGNGPLDPDPLALGIISFTNHSGMHDVICGKLMNFEIKKIKLLRTVFKLARKEKVKFYLNGDQVPLEAFDSYAISTFPPPGWIDYLTPELAE